MGAVALVSIFLAALWISIVGVFGPVLGPPVFFGVLALSAATLILEVTS
jgi:hypothetical protein